MSASELADWVAFDSIEPIGDERGDLRTGILAALLANIHRGKSSKTWKASDFMPFLPKEVKRKQLANQLRVKLGQYRTKPGS